MTPPADWPKNRLLLALPPRDLGLIRPQLEYLPTTSKQVLLDADSAIDNVYFPDSGVISVVAVYDDGSTIEMATVGREGFTGAQAALGAEMSSARLLVQVPGSATKMSRTAFVQAMQALPTFQALMLSYVQAFMEQILVSGACNGAHSVRQRLARWLLMMRDRSDSDTLPLTHDLLAEMLGVQRPTVTIAAQDLEETGVIRRGRRQVTITDRYRLGQASCECYQLVRARIAAHLPNSYT